MMGWHTAMGWNWANWFLVFVLLLLVIALIVWAITISLRSQSAPRAAAPPPLESTATVSALPQQILAERFARGEIDEDEYEQRRAHLVP